MVVKDFDTNDNVAGLIEVTLSTKETGGVSGMVIDSFYENVDKNVYDIHYCLGFEELGLEHEVKSERAVCSKSGLKQQVKETVNGLINNNHREFLGIIDNYISQNPCSYIDEEIYKFNVYSRLIKNYKGLEKLEITVFIKEKDNLMFEFKAYVGVTSSSKLTKISDGLLPDNMKESINSIIIEKLRAIKDWGFLKED